MLSAAVYVPLIFIILVIILAFILNKDARKLVHFSTKGMPYHDEIKTSVEYIIRNLLESGRFKYRNNVDPTIEYENESYNSLRHAGVLHCLFLYEKYTNDLQYHDKRLLSSEYFIKRYIEKIENFYNCVISIPQEEGLNIKIAKSGAAGVALSALSNLYDKSSQSNEIDLELLQSLGDFLLNMQNPDDGNIYAYYDFDKIEINKSAQAIYYPAEAAAGLMNLYEIDPQTKWVDCAKKALLYLAKSQENKEIVFDHWALYAIEKIFNHNLAINDEYKILQNYAEQMVIPILTAQITNPKHVYFGAFKDNVRSCIIGTIMEGLGSAYYCTNSDRLKKVIYKSMVIGCMFLSRTQVKTGINAGGLPNSANWVKPGVTPNASVIRIDNVEHVVSAWLKFQQIHQSQSKI